VALLLHRYSGVTRRIAIVLAALIIPGGLLALAGVALVRAFTRTVIGRRAWNRVLELLRPSTADEPLRQAA